MKTHFLQLILKQQKLEAAKKLRRDGVHSSTLREKKTPSSFLSYPVDTGVTAPGQPLSQGFRQTLPVEKSQLKRGNLNEQSAQAPLRA